MLTFNEHHSFSLISEVKDSKSVVFTFGRFNPVTNGHEKLVNLVIETAKRKKADPLVFPSQSQDSKKNPLMFKDKIKYMKKFFPKAKIVNDVKMKNPYIILKVLSDAGYKDVTMVVGGDRVQSFDAGIRKYIKHPDPKKSFDFDNFEVKNAGERAGEISASLMRGYAKDDDFDSFKKGLPSTSNDKITRAIFNDVQNGINIK